MSEESEEIERFVELPTPDRFFQRIGDAELEMRVRDADAATVRTQFVPGGAFGFEISCEYSYAGYDCNQHITLDREAAEALYERLDRVLESDRR